MSGVSTFVATLGSGVALWLILSAESVRAFLQYHLERGIEIESTYSALLILTAVIVGIKPDWSFDHGSYQLVTPWSTQVVAWVVPTQVVVGLLVMWRFRVSGRNDWGRYCGVAVLAFVVSNKVLSPQFLIWVLPYVALLHGSLWRKIRWIFLWTCVITTALFPFLLQSLLDFAFVAVALLILRNFMLLYVLFLLLYSKDDSSIDNQ